MSVTFGRDNQEIISVVNAIATEKNISKETIFVSIEKALFDLALSSYGEKYDFHVKINRNSGAVTFGYNVLVVEAVNDSFREITLDAAMKISKSAKIDDIFIIDMPLPESGYDVMSTVRKNIMTSVIGAEKEQEFKYFESLIGNIVTATVKKVSYGGILVAIEKNEAFIRKSDMIAGEFESIRVGSKINAIVESVERSDVRPQALLSRASTAFLEHLFKQEIPEIYDGVIQIRGLVREAGSRAKVAVFSEDSSVDPVAACIGVRGRRIQNITRELAEERIDIILWNQDKATFLMNALKEIPVVSINVDNIENTLDVIIPEENISSAIGRKGQNVRLLSRLTDCTVHFMTESESSAKKIEAFNTTVSSLIAQLDVEEIIAQLLVSDGFSSIDIIAKSDIRSIARIEGFSTEITEVIHERATSIISAREAETVVKCKEAETYIAKHFPQTQVDKNLLIQCIIHDMTTLEDIADCSILDVKDVIGEGISDDIISQSIMIARKETGMIQ